METGRAWQRLLGATTTAHPDLGGGRKDRLAL